MQDHTVGVPEVLIVEVVSLAGRFLYLEREPGIESSQLLHQRELLFDIVVYPSDDTCTSIEQASSMPSDKLEVWKWRIEVARRCISKEGVRRGWIEEFINGMAQPAITRRCLTILDIILQDRLV
jgi:hypothetical protein